MEACVLVVLDLGVLGPEAMIWHLWFDLGLNLTSNELKCFR